VHGIGRELSRRHVVGRSIAVIVAVIAGLGHRLRRGSDALRRGTARLTAKSAFGTHATCIRDCTAIADTDHFVDIAIAVVVLAVAHLDPLDDGTLTRAPPTI
jgi:hypothetical protein